MPKTFPQELAQWLKQREATKARRDKHLVAFLALKGDVQAAIEAGYSLMTIWKHLHDQAKLPCRYETFLKHVRRHIKDAAAAQPGASCGHLPELARSPVAKKAAAPRLPSPSNPVRPAPSAPAPALTGFSFNSQPKKEDLL